MDEFDESLGPENATASSMNSLLWAAIAAAVLGILVGAGGIFLALRAGNQIKEFEAQLAAAPDKTPALEASLKDLDERLVKLGNEFVKLGRQDRQIQDNTQAAFDSVTREVRANRENLNQLTAKLTELVERLENWSPPRSSRPATAARTNPDASSADSTPSSETDAEAPEGDGGRHFVESGDTLSRIAEKYGVSLSQLQRANPTVNPRALQIGQEIIIPQP